MSSQIQSANLLVIKLLRIQHQIEELISNQNNL